VSLELGGKNASVVFDDCDFEKTVATVTRSAFTNQGQVCLSGSRVFVQVSVTVVVIQEFSLHRAYLYSHS